MPGSKYMFQGNWFKSTPNGKEKEAEEEEEDEKKLLI